MNQQTQKIAVPILIVAVALVGIGYYSGQYVGTQRQEQMLEEIFGNVVLAGNLSGKIAAIASDKSSVSVEVDGITGVGLPQEYRNKTVLITGDTKIVLMKNKSPEAWNEDVATYQVETTKVKGSTTFAPPPSPYSEKEITVGDLQVGDSVNFGFNPADGASVLDSRFTATTVSVIRYPQPPVL